MLFRCWLDENQPLGVFVNPNSGFVSVVKRVSLANTLMLAIINFILVLRFCPETVLFSRSYFDLLLVHIEHH